MDGNKGVQVKRLRRKRLRKNYNSASIEQG